MSEIVNGNGEGEVHTCRMCSGCGFLCMFPVWADKMLTSIHCLDCGDLIGGMEYHGRIPPVKVVKKKFWKVSFDYSVGGSGRIELKLTTIAEKHGGIRLCRWREFGEHGMRVAFRTEAEAQAALEEAKGEGLNYGSSPYETSTESDCDLHSRNKDKILAWLNEQP